jgi:hypothetical protein
MSIYVREHARAAQEGAEKMRVRVKFWLAGDKTISGAGYFRHRLTRYE